VPDQPGLWSWSWVPLGVATPVAEHAITGASCAADNIYLPHSQRGIQLQISALN